MNKNPNPNLAQFERVRNKPGHTSDYLLSLPFDEGIFLLCRDPDLPTRLKNVPTISQFYLESSSAHAVAAFEVRDENALAVVHRALFNLYNLHTSDPADICSRNQFNPFLCEVKDRLESKWISHTVEAFQCGAYLSAEELCQELVHLWSSHRASTHPLFDFLENDASIDAIRGFFRSDSSLNIRFFDLLAFSLIGSREAVRGEISQNIWDESGRGNPKMSHVQLFRDLLDSLGIGQAVDEHASALTWQGLAGHNLFMLTCLNRQHNFKALGVMAITELMDPTSYAKLLSGCCRLGLDTKYLTYYSEHVTIDIEHADGWLNNVITPVVRQTPSATSEIILGAQLRLASCELYFDDLLERLRFSE